MKIPGNTVLVAISNERLRLKIDSKETLQINTQNEHTSKTKIIEKSFFLFKTSRPWALVRSLSVQSAPALSLEMLQCAPKDHLLVLLLLLEVLGVLLALKTIKTRHLTLLACANRLLQFLVQIQFLFN